jgi:hypothetical protein
MNKTTKLLIALLSVACVASTTAALAGCSDNNSSTSNADATLTAIYNSETENGTTMTYEEWLKSKFQTPSKGDKGDQGEQGEKGDTGEKGISILYIRVEGNKLIAYYSDGTHQEVDVISNDLELGENTINFTATDGDLTRVFTASKDGTYILSAQSNSDAYIYGDDAFNPYIAEGETSLSYKFTLKAGESITFTCSSASMEDATYVLTIAEYAPTVMTLNKPVEDYELTSSTSFDGTIEIETAGKYKLAFTDFSVSAGMMTFTATVNDTTYTLSANNDFTVDADFVAGDNTVTISISYGYGSTLVNIGVVESLKSGANTITLAEDQVSTLAFTATAETIYEFTVVEGANAYIYGDDSWTPYLNGDEIEPVLSYKVSLDEGDTIFFNCASIDGDAAEYVITVAEYTPMTLTVDTQTEAYELSSSNGFYSNITAAASGSYTVALQTSASAGQKTLMLKVNGKAYTLDYTNNFTATVTLAEGENLLTITTTDDGTAEIKVTVSQAA